MIENIIIPNKRTLEEKKKKILEEGKEKFHVLSDFDRTLTKAFVDGQKSPTVIAQIRNGKYLTSDYASKAHTLFDKYHPIEVNPKISINEKKKKMHEWWTEHFNLLVESGFNKKVIKEIVSKRTLEFRGGILEFINFLHNKNIPLIIMSAGPGDMIEEYLKQDKKLYKNIHVIANLYDWDKDGRAVKVREPIIHSMNKDETAIQNYPVFKKIKERKNVLLLGDGVEDIGVVKGFDYDNLISVGFLNENIDEQLELFKENFDVIISNDGSMSYVNKLLREMIK